MPFTNLVAANVVLNIPCYYDTGADTTAVTIDGYTTNEANYIKIYTPNSAVSEANLSQRHSGKWHDGKYRLLVSGSAISVNDDHVWIDGLQLDNAANDWAGSISNNGTGASGSAKIKVSNNIFRYNNPTGSNNRGIDIRGSVPGSTAYIWNNVMYGFGPTGSVAMNLVDTDFTYYVYNNTLHVPNNSTSIGIYSISNIVAKNNIVSGFGNTGTYVGTFLAGTDYNATDSADAIGQGSNNRVSQTFSFVDAANQNFHLASSDAGARNGGVDLQRDSNLAFDRDIDGQVRTSPWDVGADQTEDTQVQVENKSTNIDSGLVGHWTFDGPDIDWTAASGQIKDKSSKGNNGLVGGLTKTSVADGKLGQGLSFNGTSGAIAIGNTNQAVNTISFWVKPVTTSQYAVDFDGGSHYVRINSGTVSAFGFSSPTIYIDGIVSATFPDTNWHHITITTASAITANNLTIGKVSSNYFSGTFDDVRIYSRALSATEVDAVYESGQVTVQKNIKGVANGLVGYWSFDGPTISGTTVTDQSGQGNNGTISGATVADGKVGQGLSFDGVSGYVEMGDFMYSDSFTVCAWVNGNNLNSVKDIVIKRNLNGINEDFTGGEWQLFIGNGNIRFMSWDSSAVVATNTTGLSILQTNRWYHVCGVQGGNGSAAIVYLDGIQDGSALQTNVMKNSNDFIQIGVRSGSIDNRFWSGKLDEVRIYNRALSAQEISNLYQIGQVKIRK